MLNERLEESAVTRTMPTEVDATSEGGMIGRERWDEIRRMYYEERFGISRIARTLDLDRKTVRRCVRQREWRPYRRTKGEPTLLSKHEAYLRERAPRVCYSARILYQELTKDRAYTGSYETVKRFVAPLRELQVLAEGTQMRFETAPGQQSQIDWGQALVSFSSARRPVHFFVMTLGFSRRGFYFACADERLGQFLDAHERAFEYFGGHTHEHLYDRARTVCYPNGEGRVVWTLLLACIGLLAIWPAFLMPRGLYELVYGWRYPKVRDCGDAILTDSGPGASADRYVADYGYLPLDAETEMTFRLCALPRDGCSWA
jgi:transposase